MRTLTKAIATLALTVAAMGMIPSVADAASTPTNLKQTGGSGSSIDYTWDAVVNADYYETQWSDGLTWSNSDESSRAEQSVGSLSAGKTYYVKVRSVEYGDDYWDDTDNIYSEWSAPFEVVTAPDANGMKPLSATPMANSITLTWTAADGATSYNVASGYGAEKLEGTTAATSFTVPNLAADTLYWLYVTPVRTSASGYAAAASRLYDLYRTAEAPVVAPGVASSAHFGIATASGSTGSASFYATDPSKQAAGYEVEVFKVKGGKKVKTISSSTSTSATYKFAKNTPFKYRVRYYTLSHDGQKLYGGYSGFRYFTLHKVSGKRVYNLSSSKCKIKLNWGKVTGAKSYTVYISTRSDGGFKKVKTVGKNKKSLTFTKYGKKKLSRFTKYYIKVVPKVKVGKKVVKNDAQGIQSTY